jgi:acetoacetyl-CoA reductase
MRALVTGAARGIGAAIAERLRADGMDVITLDRDPGCDLRLDLANDALPVFDDVDVCVPNAGITTTVAPSHRMTQDQWQRDIDVNLTGAFRTVQACLAGMRERRFGRIVVMSSMAARTGLPGQAAYTASKAGLLGMMRTLAGEYAGRGPAGAHRGLPRSSPRQGSRRLTSPHRAGAPAWACLRRDTAAASWSAASCRRL